MTCPRPVQFRIEFETYQGVFIHIKKIYYVLTEAIMLTFIIITT